MRTILALVVAGGLSLGMVTTSHAQVAVGVNPWGGVGVSVGSPYSYYSSGYYGMGGYGVAPGAALYSSGYSGYYGVAPGAALYSSGYSGYYGVAPVTYGYTTTAYPAMYGYGYYPAYGYGGFGLRRGGWPVGRRMWRY